MGQLRHCTRCTYLGCNGGFIGHYSFIVWLFWHRHGYKAQKRRVWAWLTKIDLSKVEDIELDGINTRDYPDFCDAFISGATYKGRPMSDVELDRLNDRHSDFVYECVLDKIY